MTEKYNELSKEMEIQTAMCQVHTCMLCMRTSVTQVVEEEWYNHTLQDVLSLHYLNWLFKAMQFCACTAYLAG